MRIQLEEFSAAERIDELAELLAAGVVRLLAPKSSPICSEGGEVSLHIPPGRSGDPHPENDGRAGDDG